MTSRDNPNSTDYNNGVDLFRLDVDDEMPPAISVAQQTHSI